MEKPNEPVTVNKVGEIQTLLPRATFRWPKGITLKALDEISTIAFPKELFGPEEKMGSIIIADNEVEFIMDKREPNLVFLRIKKGLSASLTKSSEAILIPDSPNDDRPKHFQISRLDHISHAGL